jgi:hypothetical protein
MTFEGTFPFGRPSTLRPPRRSRAAADAFVMGVYPSALHIQWRLPEWARARFGWECRSVGALAVDVEPEVFWDGLNQDDLVTRWKRQVGWAEGDETGCFGSCTAANNGSSGRAVAENVLKPMGITAQDTWFTDCIPWFFIKSSTSRPQQAEVIQRVYEPVARELGLGFARLPARPNPEDLVDITLREEGARLKTEIAESRTSLLVTLGEEPRRVMCSLAEDVGGSPRAALKVGPEYGRRGWLRVDGRRTDWYALTHPGNRSSQWAEARDGWEARMRAGTQ